MINKIQSTIILSYMNITVLKTQNNIPKKNDESASYLQESKINIFIWSM